MNSHKVKAAEVLIESLKLIVTISMAFFAGFLALHAAGGARASPLLYATLFAFAVAAILSVININALINKFNRGDDELVSNRIVRRINVGVIAAFFFGLALAVALLFRGTTGTHIISAEATIITDESITIGNKPQAAITIKKHESGRLDEVRINSD